MNESSGQSVLILAMGLLCGVLACVWGPWLAIAVIGFVAAPMLMLHQRAEAKRSTAPPG